MQTDRLDEQIRVRVSENIFGVLKYLSEEKRLSKSDIIRRSINQMLINECSEGKLGFNKFTGQFLIK